MPATRWLLTACRIRSDSELELHQEADSTSRSFHVTATTKDPGEESRRAECMSLSRLSDRSRTPLENLKVCIRRSSTNED